ncbi:hypothetical protein J8M97_25420 [Gordonia polyisoprenivorans]|uniref:hypothetical protein n=1 Tax=Gordonia polyisoprenivorans TaxID=84595 RepID=UPI0003A32B40|nr:hypothetical protein [Gordonia polyisoprenivorans]QUD82952.1 hypothetical protein J8M97_25420 [Gordonia polyisoprenivorans]
MRQQAVAAASVNDRDGFAHYSREAAQIAATAETDMFAPYATPAYVASEVAPALLKFGMADQVIATLTPALDDWPDEQARDRSIARTRLVRAHTAVGDYTNALAHAATALDAFRSSPNQRARLELRQLRRHLEDQVRRSTRTLPMDELRKRVSGALRGDLHA